MTNREMDAYIAEKCMGFQIVDHYHKGVVCVVPSDEDQNVFEYSPTQNMTDAWPVFEWLLENHPWIYHGYKNGRADILLRLCMGKPSLVVLNDREVRYYNMYSPDTPLLVLDNFYFQAETFPLAICKAAVAAVEEIERVKNDGR